MSIYRLHILSIVLFKIQADVSAQTLFGKKLDGMECIKPCDCYKVPTGIVENDRCNLCKQSKEMPGRSRDSRYWIVYSDREDNPTYTDQNFGKATGITLSFMQSCYVAQEIGNALRLVRIPLNGRFDIENKGKDAAVFKSTAEDLGWVDKNKLLLWQNSLIDDSTTFAKKAVSVKRLVEKSQTISEYINKKGHSILDLFSAPLPEEKNDLDKELKMFQYLYIYKEENSMYLLGKTNEITVQSAIDDMLGWAPKSQVHTWRDALCLRINFDEEAREDRVKNNFDVKFFASSDKARLYKKGQAVNGLPFLYDDPTATDKKDNPYLLGYPIIDGRDFKENIFRTGYITNTVNDKGQLLYPVSKQADNDQKISAAQNQRDNINYVFVLDGKTKSIINKIADAI